MKPRQHRTLRTITLAPNDSLIAPITGLPESAKLFECIEHGDLVIARNPDKREWCTPRNRTPAVLWNAHEFTADKVTVIRSVGTKRVRHYALTMGCCQEASVIRLSAQEAASYERLESWLMAPSAVRCACMKQPKGDNLPHFFLLALNAQERHDVLQLMLDYHRLMFPQAPLPVFDTAQAKTKWMLQPYTVSYCVKSISPCTFVSTGANNER